MTTGQRLKALREEKGLSQQEVAKALGVSRETVKMWENDERDIKTQGMIALANFYNVSADYLLGRVECKSTDLDLQTFCAKTGLTDGTVQTLINFKSTGIPGDDWGNNHKEDVFMLINAILDQNCQDRLGHSAFPTFVDVAISISRLFDGINEDIIIGDQKYAGYQLKEWLLKNDIDRLIKRLQLIIFEKKVGNKNAQKETLGE